MYRILKGKENKKAKYAHRYAMSVMVDLEIISKVKELKNYYFCKDFDNNWYRCSADGEADNPVNESLSRVLDEYFKEAA